MDRRAFLAASAVTASGLAIRAAAAVPWSGPTAVRADQGAAAHGIPDCLSGGTEVTVLAARSANFVRLAVEEPRS